LPFSNPELVGYDTERSRNFFNQAIERASSLPGVEAVAATRLLPLGDSSNSNGPILKEGETLARGSAGRTIMTTVVSSGYFRAMEIPILDGRDFDDRDHAKSQRVVIVNQQMASTLWPGESAVGKRIFIGAESRDAIEVVGVVKTGKYNTLAEDPKPFFYYPMSQRRPGSMALVMRTNVDPRGLAGSLRKEVQNIDRSVPVSSVKTMTEHLTYALWAPNMAASFSLAFGVLAILVERGRALQRDGVRGFAAHARGWHSHGARREPRGRVEDDHGTRNATGGDWCCARVVAVARTRACALVAVDRRQRLRRDDVRDRFSAVGARCLNRLLLAGAARDEDRSARSSAIRIRRIRV
jgi:hypothetical protein